MEVVTTEVETITVVAGTTTAMATTTEAGTVTVVAGTTIATATTTTEVETTTVVAGTTIAEGGAPTGREPRTGRPPLPGTSPAIKRVVSHLCHRSKSLLISNLTLKAC